MFETFDKVNSTRLLRKLQSKGDPEEILAVLKSSQQREKHDWLSEKKFSADMHISNMVYQGTVLGPPL